MRKSGRRYRGSRGGTGVIIPVLVVLCIIAAGTLYFVNESSTFRREGTGVVSEAENMQEAVKEGVVVSEQASGTQQNGEATSDVQNTTSSAMAGYFVPISSVKSIEQFDALLTSLPQGVSTLVLEVKAEDGTLAFGSEHEFVKDKQITGDDETLKTVIAKARNANLGVALYISCFKDNGAGQNNFKNAVLLENGYVWRDENSIRWLSPYAEGTRAYITGIIGKLTTFAPDEIILGNVSFPVTADTAVFDETLGSKSDMLALFIDEAKKAAGDVKLSAVFGNFNDRRKPMSGQREADFEKFDTLYIETRQTQLTRTFDEGKALFGADCNIVPVSDDALNGEFIIKK